MSSDTQSNGVTDKQILSTMAEASRPYVTPKRLAERLPFTSQRAGDRLRRLWENGEIYRDKVSANGVLYTLENYDGSE